MPGTSVARCCLTADPRQWRWPGGLRLLPDNYRAAVNATILAVLLACLLVALSDWVMRDVLPPVYRDRYTSPLWPRSAWISLAAMREEVVYRLGLQSLLAALPALAGRKTGPRWMIAAIVLAQLANVGVLALVWPPYGLIRFWLVGCIWGWLYWKHGFASALAGHGMSHLLLDPLLLMVLA